jgi:hypothetical protein
VDDELDAFGDDQTDLQRSTGVLGAVEHREFVEVQDADRVAVRVKDLLVRVAVLRALATITGSKSSSYLDGDRDAETTLPEVQDAWRRVRHLLRIRRGLIGLFGFQRGVMVGSRCQFGLPA